jgi:hypothetical protein
MWIYGLVTTGLECVLQEHTCALRTYATCVRYKGVGPEPPLGDNASDLDLATLGYGVANYYWYEQRRHDAAVALWQRVVNTSYWAAFGYIASEAELFRLGSGGDSSSSNSRNNSNSITLNPTATTARPGRSRNATSAGRQRAKEM